MCQKKPGPRCTAHAKKTLIKAKRTYDALSASHPADDERVLKAKRDLATAMVNFNATPGGMKVVEDKIASLQIEIDKIDHLQDQEVEDDPSTHVSREVRYHKYEVENQKRYLERRLQQSKEMREYQKAALAKVNSFTTASSLSEYWYDEDIEQKWQCDNGDEIRIYQRERFCKERKTAWRLRNGQPITMISFLAGGSGQYRDTTVLADIEVNPAFRGHKLGVDTIKSVGEHYGTLHTTGRYSVSGSRSLAADIPLVPGGHEDHDPFRLHYNFVDWQAGDLNN